MKQMWKKAQKKITTTTTAATVLNDRMRGQERDGGGRTSKRECDKCKHAMKQRCE